MSRPSSPGARAGVDGLAIVRADGVEPSPWRNGGGVTRELLRRPAPQAADAGRSADDWVLRISLADIAADGAFSAFDGVTRWFAVLAGAGVDLHWTAPDSTLDLESGLAMRMADSPLEFDGADAPFCSLLDGPTRDLNVMVRRDRADARLVRAGWQAPWRWSGQARGVFALRPLLLTRAGVGNQASQAPTTIALPALTLAWHDGADASAWSVAPGPQPDPAKPQGSRFPDAGGAAAPPAYWIGLRQRDAAPPHTPAP